MGYKIYIYKVNYLIAVFVKSSLLDESYLNYCSNQNCKICHTISSLKIKIKNKICLHHYNRTSINKLTLNGVILRKRNHAFVRRH